MASSTQLLRDDVSGAGQLSNPSTSRARFGYDTLSEGAQSFVTKPVQEVQETVSEMLLLKLFWNDMERRERTRAHQATLVLGIAQFVLVIVYIILLEANHVSNIDYRYLNFIVMEVFIASAAQTVYSVRGICLENSPMLLIANINAVFLAIRIGLTVKMELQPRGVDAAFSALYALLTTMHVAASFTAWGGEFSRFMSFCISAEQAIQNMFRQYQFLTSIAALDLQMCVMTAAALLFFVDTHFWHYIVVSVLMFINIALHSLIRRVIRHERPLALAVVVPYDIGYCVFIIVSLYSSSVFGATIEDSCYNTATFSIVVFCVVRVALFVAMFVCTRNFGHGMIEAFQQQKTSREFVLSVKRNFKPMFLPADAQLTRV